MDHDYNDVAAFLGIDPEPQTPPLLEAAETRDPLNINAPLEPVPSQFQEPPPQQSSSSFADGVLQGLHNLDQILASRNTVFTPYQSSSQFGSNEPMIGSSHDTRNMNAQLQSGRSQSQIKEANVHSTVAYWHFVSSVATDYNQQQFRSNQPIWHQNQFNMGSFDPGASSSTQEQPPPQQSSSSFAAGVIQNLHNLDQSSEPRNHLNTVFTPYQSFSQFRSNEPISSSHETRNMHAHLHPGPSQSQISSFEKANVHSSVSLWPHVSSSAADSNQQQFSSNQPIWNQNEFNMGYFHPGSASYSTAVQPLPSSLPVAANQLATSHVSPFEQHPSIMQPFATQEEANAYREEAKRRYYLRKSRRKLMTPNSNKYKSRSDGAKKKKRNKGRFVKKGEDYDYDPSQQGL